MKKYVVNSIVNYIKKNTECSQEKEEIIRYGIGNLYLQVTKTVVITLLAIMCKVFIPYIVFLLCFNAIRSFSFGLHAKKSWQCWISSILIFVGVPFLISKLNLQIYIKQIISIICVITIYTYSPADTEKRPIVSIKRRNIYKFISTIISITYSFMCLYINNNVLSNSLLFALILQSIIISPFTYRLFGLAYNNYKRLREEEVYVC